MKQSLSSLFLLLAAAIWGFAFSAQKVAGALPEFTMTSLRGFIAACFLIPLIPIFDHTRKNGRRLISKRRMDITGIEWIGGIVCGLILALASAVQQFGITGGTDAGKTAFITALYVVIVPIFGLFTGKRAGLRIWASIFIAVVGFYFLCITGTLSIALSDLVVLLCALIFSFHILAIDYFSPKCDGVRMSAIQFLFVGIFSAILAFIFDPPLDLALVGENILPLLYLGVGSSGIAYTLQIVGQKGVNPAVASVLLSLESVFGVIGSAIFLGEKMTAREHIGCCIVFLAVILAQIDLSALKKGQKDKNSLHKD